MTFLIPTLVVVFAAFCVWLTVRIVNRKEGWVKWMLATVIGLPVLYVASFGPACWIVSRQGTEEGRIPRIYWPIGAAALRAPNFVLSSHVWYSTIGMRKETDIAIPFDPFEADSITAWLRIPRK